MRTTKIAGWIAVVGLTLAGHLLAQRAMRPIYHPPITARHLLVQHSIGVPSHPTGPIGGYHPTGPIGGYHPIGPIGGSNSGPYSSGNDLDSRNGGEGRFTGGGNGNDVNDPNKGGSGGDRSGDGRSSALRSGSPPPAPPPPPPPPPACFSSSNASATRTDQSEGKRPQFTVGRFEEQALDMGGNVVDILDASEYAGRLNPEVFWIMVAKDATEGIGKAANYAVVEKVEKNEADLLLIDKERQVVREITKELHNAPVGSSQRQKLEEAQVRILEYLREEHRLREQRNRKSSSSVASFVFDAMTEDRAVRMKEYRIVGTSLLGKGVSAIAGQTMSKALGIKEVVRDSVDSAFATGATQAQWVWTDAQGRHLGAIAEKIPEKVIEKVFFGDDGEPAAVVSQSHFGNCVDHQIILFQTKPTPPQTLLANLEVPKEIPLAEPPTAVRLAEPIRAQITKEFGPAVMESHQILLAPVSVPMQTLRPIESRPVRSARFYSWGGGGDDDSTTSISSTTSVVPDSSTVSHTESSSSSPHFSSLNLPKSFELTGQPMEAKDSFKFNY